MTKTIDAIYERGVLKPSRKLPFREHTRLKLTITKTRGAIHVSLTPWTDATRGAMQLSPRLAKRLADDPDLTAWNS